MPSTPCVESTARFKDERIAMYDVEATVTENAPTQLKLSADWPVGWLRETGLRTVEIQRELLDGETLELLWVPTERAEIKGNRGNWRKLHVGLRVLVMCFFPGERIED
jgi:hypothetical protein